MSKLTLMGARHFLDMPKGTMYIEFWENSEEELEEIIDQYKNGTLEIPFNDIHIYGNNYGSMSIYADECTNFPADDIKDYIFYYDANVVGDANPSKTLYLVFDETSLPDYIEVYSYITDKYEKISKEDVLKLRQIFIDSFDKETEPTDNKKDKGNEWAREILETEYKDNYFVNFKL